MKSRTTSALPSGELRQRCSREIVQYLFKTTLLQLGGSPIKVLCWYHVPEGGRVWVKTHHSVDS